MLRCVCNTTVVCTIATTAQQNTIKWIVMTVFSGIVELKHAHASLNAKLCRISNIYHVLFH